MTLHGFMRVGRALRRIVRRTRRPLQVIGCPVTPAKERVRIFEEVQSQITFAMDMIVAAERREVVLALLAAIGLSEGAAESTFEIAKAWAGGLVRQQ